MPNYSPFFQMNSSLPAQLDFYESVANRLDRPNLGVTVFVKDERDNYLLNPKTRLPFSHVSVGPRELLFDGAFRAVANMTPQAVWLKFIGEYETKSDIRENLFEGILLDDRDKFGLWIPKTRIIDRYARFAKSPILSVYANTLMYRAIRSSSFR